MCYGEKWSREGKLGRFRGVILNRFFLKRFFEKILNKDLMEIREYVVWIFAGRGNGMFEEV